jgi:hypothetical protein
MNTKNNRLADKSFGMNKSVISRTSESTEVEAWTNTNIAVTS